MRWVNYHHFKMINFAYMLYLFLVLSTVQRTNVSWAAWCNSLLQKLGNGMLYCLKSNSEVPIRKFQNVWFVLLGFYGISTMLGYLMPNMIYSSILDINVLLGFYGISTTLGYLMPNLVYAYILDIYDLQT